MRRSTTNVPTIPHRPPTTVAGTSRRTKNSYRNGSSRKSSMLLVALLEPSRMLVIGAARVTVLVGDVAEDAQLVGYEGHFSIADHDHLRAVRRFQNARRKHARRMPERHHAAI